MTWGVGVGGGGGGGGEWFAVAEASWEARGKRQPMQSGPCSTCGTCRERMRPAMQIERDTHREDAQVLVLGVQERVGALADGVLDVRGLLDDLGG